MSLDQENFRLILNFFYKIMIFYFFMFYCLKILILKIKSNVLFVNAKIL